MAIEFPGYDWKPPGKKSPKVKSPKVKSPKVKSPGKKSPKKVKSPRVKTESQPILTKRVKNMAREGPLTGYRFCA